MAAAVIQDLLEQTEGKLDPAEVEDVIMGCAMPEAAQGLNFARVIALRAGLPVDVPGMTVNRFCSSGVQTIAIAAERIIANGADTVIAGGAETMSLVPMAGFRTSPNPYMAENDPYVYMSMPHRRARGRRVQRQPRGYGRVLLPESREGRRSGGRGQVRRGDRPVRV
jgi:acetyl-CoA acyltransferase